MNSPNSHRRSVSGDYTSRGHHRSMSRDSRGSGAIVHSPSPPPTQTFHPNILPRSVPTPALVESVAGGAHYAGAKVDSETLIKRRRSSNKRSHTELKSDHKRVLDDLTELFCARPTLEILERSWTKDAEFEDPYCKTKGYDQFAAQWFGLTKILVNAEQLSKRVMSSTDNPNRFIYFQTMEYTLRWFNKKKVIESIVTVDLDDNEKIIRLVDQWEGKELPSRWGASFLRTMNGKMAPWFVHIPKAPRRRT
ncbi:hypothetical protein D9619_005939 [Psilocybe cf. subviscida]|uniref:Uncharacterized protein n=1 Tax=Psilocybe cf. subviscida TaxID=2480587 RepID=A0A8H5FBS7_9AGAR|nr:hypothetical protein D9619_005939 [Psilocybe cf. subviscida]